MSRLKQATLSPIDVVILIKLALSRGLNISQSRLAAELFISQSEVSKSLTRSRYARLISGDYNVMLQGLMEFLEHGVKYCFPQQPGAIVRGIPTAHSYGELSNEIVSSDDYVWPSAKGTLRGQAIAPLYPSIIEAVLLDNQLHQVLALVDAIRVGRNREKNSAVSLLWNILLNEEYPNKPESYRYGSQSA
jgi:hypothetical protein